MLSSIKIHLVHQYFLCLRPNSSPPVDHFGYWIGGRFICRRRSSLCHHRVEINARGVMRAPRNAPRGLLTEPPPLPPTPAGSVSHRRGRLRASERESPRSSAAHQKQRAALATTLARTRLDSLLVARFPMLLKIDLVNGTRALFSAQWSNVWLQEWQIWCSFSKPWVNIMALGVTGKEREESCWRYATCATRVLSRLHSSIINATKSWFLCKIKSRGIWFFSSTKM